jgi:TrmH family RNA methyltransferase
MTRAPHLITSLTNDRIKAIRALESRKERKETGLFVAEGASIVMTARANGREPRTLVFETGKLESDHVRNLVTAVLSGRAEVLEVSHAVLEKLSAKDNPQTVLGVFEQRFAPVPAPATLTPRATWLALEEIRDPGNLGTIIRTVDAVGAAGIVLVGTCCDPYSRECVRATMGSIFAVPLVKMTREEFLAWRAEWPGDVAGLHLSGTEDFRAAELKEPVLLLMGSEGPGLSDSLTRSASRLLKIPMAGQLDSLNLAVATALSLYQIRGRYLKL